MRISGSYTRQLIRDIDLSFLTGVIFYSIPLCVIIPPGVRSSHQGAVRLAQDRIDPPDIAPDVQLITHGPQTLHRSSWQRVWLEKNKIGLPLVMEPRRLDRSVHSHPKVYHIHDHLEDRRNDG